MSKLINAFRSASAADRAAFIATLTSAAQESKGKAKKASEPKAEPSKLTGRAKFRAEMRAKFGPKWFEHPEAIAIKAAKAEGFKALVAKSKAKRKGKAGKAAEPRPSAKNGTFLPAAHKAKGGKANKASLAAAVAEAFAAKLP